MPDYCILEQLDNGAVVITFEWSDGMWTIVDVAGNAFSLDYYLSLLQKRI
jgi:hypothetical protein